MEVYQDLRQGARRVLLVLEPGTVWSVSTARAAVRQAYQTDDPRTVFHLEHLAFIGLVDKTTLPNQEEGAGYRVNELGVHESNYIALGERRPH